MEKVLYKEVGSRISILRKERGFTQTKLATEIGISRKFLIEIERGEKGFSAEILMRLAKVLNVKGEYIMQGTSDVKLDMLLVQMEEKLESDYKHMRLQLARIRAELSKNS